MAGLGDSGKGAARRRRRDGLATDVASQLEAEAALGAEEASESRVKPDVVAPAPTGMPALTKASRQREKGSWYVSVELADALRDACEFLNDQGFQLNGSRVSVGALIEPPIQRFLEDLYQQHNDGKPFPTSLATKSSRTRRKKR